MKVPIPDLCRVFPELAGLDDRALETWLMRYADYDHMLPYSLLIWPPFTEHEGCVFLGSGVPSTYPEWKAKYGSDSRAIEGMLNHRHIGDIFLSAKNPSQEAVAYVGELLRETWTAKLGHDFPGKQFTVDFPRKFDVKLVDPSITFYSGPPADRGLVLTTG